MKTKTWTYQWNIFFNRDLNKQAHEMILSRKSKEHSYPSSLLDNVEACSTFFQKHLGIILNSRISPEVHFKLVLDQINKTFSKAATIFS